MATSQAEVFNHSGVHKFNVTEYYRLGDLGFFFDKRVELIEGDVLDRYEVPDPRLHLWTSSEFYQMTQANLFEGRRVELIDGRVMEMGEPHHLYGLAVKKAARVFEHVFGEDYCVREQASLNLDGLDHYSQPKPAIAVVKDRQENDDDELPIHAKLVLEVSSNTLRFDREKKASLFAEARIPEYWILNLLQRQLEVFRRPVADAAAVFWFSYAERYVFKEGESVALRDKPDAIIQVADLIPWPKGKAPL